MKPLHLRRATAVGMISVALVATMFGGWSTAAQSDVAPPDIPLIDVPDGTGVTLEVWGGPELAEGFRQGLDDYAALTGATIDYVPFPNPFEQNLLARWAAGDRPDILFFHGAGNWLVQLNPEVNLQPMTDQPFVARTVPGLIDATTTFRGVPYGAITRSPYVYGFFYNKAAFDAAGIEEPSEGTYESWVKLCEALKASAPDVAPTFIGGGDQWPDQAFPVGMWADDVPPDKARLLNTRELTFTDPAFVDWIAKLQEQQQLGCLNDDVLTATYDDSVQSLFNGKAATVYQGSWFYDNLVAQQSAEGVDGAAIVDEQIGYFPLSGKGTIASWEIPSGGTLYAPKTGDATSEALARGFLDYITGQGYEKFRQSVNDFPVIQGFPTPTDVPALRQEMWDQYLATGMPIFQQVIEAAYGPFETFLQEMLAGTKTPMQVGEALQAEFDRSAKLVGLEGF
jgi:raffinose/stachyose/melibiose transport system substrate-binding protein